MSNLSARLFKLCLPYTKLSRNLSKVAYTKQTMSDENITLKKITSAQRFGVGFKRMCQATLPMDSLYGTAKLFSGSLEYTKTTCTKKADKYDDTTSRYFEGPGIKYESIPPYASNWKWYAVAKKPTETDGSKNDLDRLGSQRNDTLLNKQKKQRSLEEIKKMLREKYQWKESVDDDKRT